MISRQPKIHVGLRIVAAGCIVLWLLAGSCCSIEYLCADDHHYAEAADHHATDHSHEVEAAEHADAHDAGQPSGDSHHKDGAEDSCCSTLTATVQNASAFVIAKPALLPLNFHCTVLQAQNSQPAAPKNETDRQSKRPEWVFTPVVCLDAAHRSLAPPSPAVG